MNGGGIGQDQLIEVLHFIEDLPVVKAYPQLLVLKAETLHNPDIPVEDAFFIVIAYLHDLIAFPVGDSSPCHSGGAAVQGLLQSGIHLGSPHCTALHGGEHLDIFRIRMIKPGKPPSDQIHHELCSLFRIFLPEKKEIRFRCPFQFRHLSPVDAMCIHDDLAVLRLPENPCQADHGETAAVNQIPQHISRAHTGQLVNIPHQDQAHAVRHSPQQCIHQEDIDHGAFIDNEHIPFQRILAVARIALRRLDFQQPVEGLGFYARGF